MCVYRALIGRAGRDPQKLKREGCVRQKGRKRLRRDAHQPQRQRGRRLPDERGRLRRADARFRRRADFHRPKRRVQREDQGLAGHDDVRDVRAKEKETERPLTDCRQKAKFKFLGTGVISVTPVPLLAVRPWECILAKIGVERSEFACRMTSNARAVIAPKKPERFQKNRLRACGAGFNVLNAHQI